jgi:hypothetical protein
LKSLEAKHLISTKMAMGRKFYLVHDPRVGLEHLLKFHKLSAEEVEEINQLCIDPSFREERESRTSKKSQHGFHTSQFLSWRRNTVRRTGQTRLHRRLRLS